MSTKAQLMGELKTTQEQLANALDNSVDNADATALSAALLDNVSELKSAAEEALSVAEEKLQNLEDLYLAVDDADDAVIKVMS